MIYTSRCGHAMDNHTGTRIWSSNADIMTRKTGPKPEAFKTKITGSCTESPSVARRLGNRREWYWSNGSHCSWIERKREWIFWEIFYFCFVFLIYREGREKIELHFYFPFYFVCLDREKRRESERLGIERENYPLFFVGTYWIILIFRGNRWYFDT